RSLQGRPTRSRDARQSTRLCRWSKAPMKPIKIAILGYGKIAEDQHVPSIRANPRFELVATSSRSGQGVERPFTDWRELIRSVEAAGFGVFDPGINAFSVITKIFPGAVFVKGAELQVPANAQAPIAANIELASPAADGALSVSFDFRWSDDEEWTIEIATTDGVNLRLE